MLNLLGFIGTNLIPVARAVYCPNKRIKTGKSNKG